MAFLETTTSAWRKLAAANFTDTAFGTLKGTPTKPSGAGVIDLLGAAAPGGAVQNAILLRFFGTDAENLTFDARVWGWAWCVDTASWENCLLAQFAVTLGNLTGAAGTAMGATDYEADTIVLTYGSTLDASINSNAADARGAYARVDFQGFGLLQVEFDRTGAASANALYRLF